MTDSLTQQVRDRVRQIAAEHGFSAETIGESILIREGFYCGRRFMLDGMQAVWFVEENELKVFNPDGTLLMVTSATEPSEAPLRRAA